MKTTDPKMVPNEIAKLKSILDSNSATGIILKDFNYIYDGVSTKLFWLYLNIIILLYKLHILS